MSKLIPCHRCHSVSVSQVLQVLYVGLSASYHQALPTLWIQSLLFQGYAEQDEHYPGLCPQQVFQLKPTRVYGQRPVRQTKITPCGECVGKVLESFAQVLARCWSLAQTKYMTRHNAALIALYFDGNGKGPQACRLFSSLVLTSGAQRVVPVRRRSSILRCSCLRRAHLELICHL